MASNVVLLVIVCIAIARAFDTLGVDETSCGGPGAILFAPCHLSILATMATMSGYWVFSSHCVWLVLLLVTSALGGYRD